MEKSTDIRKIMGSADDLVNLVKNDPDIKYINDVELKKIAQKLVNLRDAFLPSQVR